MSELTIAIVGFTHWRQNTENHVSFLRALPTFCIWNRDSIRNGSSLRIRGTNATRFLKPPLAEERLLRVARLELIRLIVPNYYISTYTSPISVTSAAEARGNPFRGSSKKTSSFEHFLEEKSTKRTSITRRTHNFAVTYFLFAL